MRSRESQSKDHLRPHQRYRPDGPTSGNRRLRSTPPKQKLLRFARLTGDRPDLSCDRVHSTGRWIIGLICLAMIVLLGRVIQLQTSPSPRLARLIDSQRSRLVLQARRGNLLDRRGRALASTRVAQRLFVDPQQIEDPVTFAERVGYTLGYDPAWIEKRISAREDRRYVPLDHRLSQTRVETLRGFKLPGLASQTRLVRDYPYGPLAGQVIGFVGFEGHGLEGLERMLNEPLTGTPGTLRYLRDSARRPLWIERTSYQPSTHGQSIRLSLDVTIQSFAQDHLRLACQQYSAQAGQMIVMDPHTGQILAMANYPFFDPADFSQAKPEDRRNRCVTDVFEPGSTFKAFVWAKATEAGLAQPDEIIDCTESGYYVSPKRRALRDAHAHGSITWDEVLVKSSNIGMAIVGQRMGIKPLHDAVRSFGFGSKSGSQLPGEVAGIINPLRRWNHYSETSVPMGQEVAVTSLQLARAYCAIANGGYLVTPTILAPSPASMDEPIYERVLDPDVARYTRRVLRRVVTEGTGPQGQQPTVRDLRQDRHRPGARPPKRRVPRKAVRGVVRGRSPGRPPTPGRGLRHPPPRPIAGLLRRHRRRPGGHGRDRTVTGLPGRPPHPAAPNRCNWREVRSMQFGERSCQRTVRPLDPHVDRCC